MRSRRIVRARATNKFKSRPRVGYVDGEDAQHGSAMRDFRENQNIGEHSTSVCARARTVGAVCFEKGELSVWVSLWVCR